MAGSCFSRGVVQRRTLLEPGAVQPGILIQPPPCDTSPASRIGPPARPVSFPPCPTRCTSVSLPAPLHHHAPPHIIFFHACSCRQDPCRTLHTPLRDWRLQCRPASWYQPPPPPRANFPLRCSPLRCAASAPVFPPLLSLIPALAYTDLPFKFPALTTPHPTPLSPYSSSMLQIYNLPDFLVVRAAGRRISRRT